MISTEHEAPLTTALPVQSPIDAVDFPTFTQNQLAWQDIKDGILKWPIWLTLAYQDISIRYRRSVLGPFWLTLSMAITVYSMGYLYAHLFHIELQRYYPILTAGMLTWSLIVGLVTETTDGFMVASGLILQLKLPYTLHIHRIISRNMIIFLHNIIVMIPILAFFHEYAKVNWYTLLVIPGLFAIYINSLMYGLIFAMIGSRYRDISQIVRSLIQVIFFITPVMWEPTVLPENDRIFVDLNPFFAFIQLIREPLLGRLPSATNLLVVAIMTLLGTVVSFRLFARYRARIVYWL